MHFKVLYNIMSLLSKQFDADWVYMLYYPLLKEIDINNNEKHETYSSELTDMFYFQFKLYDETIPLLSLDMFRDLLKDDFTFITNPLKSYIPKFNKPDRYLINYHDASPCFIYKSDQVYQKFRLNLYNYSLTNSDFGKISNLVDDLIRHLIINKLIKPRRINYFHEVLTTYSTEAFKTSQTIMEWLKIIVKSDSIIEVVTDQTLAPPQCFVNHILKKYNHSLLVYQHQRNLQLSDISPLIYLDIKLSNTYYSWFSKEELQNTYSSLPLSNLNLINECNIVIPKLSIDAVASIVNSSKKCLLILNSPSNKYIAGTSVGLKTYYENLQIIIETLYNNNLKITYRNDQRNTVIIPNYLHALIEEDKTSDLTQAIKKVDFCVVDRPGGAVIDVLIEKGFVLVFSKHYRRFLTNTYKTSIIKKEKIQKSKKTTLNLVSTFDILHNENF